MTISRAFKDSAKCLLGLVLQRSLPEISSTEQDALAKLRAYFAETPIQPEDSSTQAGRIWAANQNRLRELVLNDDPRRFLRWDVVSQTMFVTFFPYLFSELRHLKAHNDWSQKWKPAIRENWVGNPTPFLFYTESSGNLIHHAYHALNFEESTGRNIKDFDFVFEFGGGYGSMCRLCHNLGFEGKYVIYDLPNFSALQRYYLETLGFRISGSVHDDEANVRCLSESTAVDQIKDQIRESKNALFLATWSLSETPLAVRESLNTLWPEFDGFFLGYQHRFGEVDNVPFFESLKSLRSDLKWTSWEIGHLPGSSYLFGGSRL